MGTGIRVSAMERFRLRAGLGRWNPHQQSEAWLFLLPGLAGFIVFVLIPIVMSMGVSLTKWDLLGPPEFIGLDNYVELLTRDRVFGRVLVNTLYYTIVIVPLQLVIGLVLAVALNTQLRGMTFYRLIYFMPVVTNIVAAALVFQWLLNRDFGIISSIIWDIAERYQVPVQPPDWINSAVWSKPAVVLLTLWKNVGFTMVIYLAGLQGVPEALYDAARVDGASNWQRFRYVTIPMVSATTFFLLVIQMIGAFQLFAEPFVLFGGEPPQSTLSIVYYIWENAFGGFYRMGKATAIAWILFGIIFVVTFIQLRLQKRWVHYEV